MYVNLNKSELEKRRAGMEKNAEAELSNEEISTDMLLDPKLQEDVSTEFSDGTLNIDIDTPLGFFSVSVEIDDDLADQIIDHWRAKAVKFKKLLALAGDEK